jgi:hypothetical protein
MDPIEVLRRNRAEKVRRRGAESQEYSCKVMGEQVVIRLRRETGSLNTEKWFVQCNQVDCQYSELNESPCPLHIGLFDAKNKKRPVLRAELENAVVERPRPSP